MHWEVSHSFSSLDLVPQSMKLFQTPGGGKWKSSNCCNASFQYAYILLEIKSEWQLKKILQKEGKIQIYVETQLFYNVAIVETFKMENEMHLQEIRVYS